MKDFFRGSVHQIRLTHPLDGIAMSRRRRDVAKAYMGNAELVADLAIATVVGIASVISGARWRRGT